MKKIVVLTDTHNNLADLQKIQTILNEADLIIHCGDGYINVLQLNTNYKTKFVYVQGNCDGGSSERIIEVEGVKILIVHGHQYGVKQSLLPLTYKAKQEQVKLVLYGHTHIAQEEEIDGVIYFNAGTMQKYTTQKSYGYVVIHDHKIITKIVKVN